MGVAFHLLISHRISENLSAEPLSLADSADVLYLVDNNREILTRFLYWVDEVQDLSSAANYIQQRIESRQKGAAWFKLLVEGRMAGVFGIKNVYDHTATAEIGYWLASEFHGQQIILHAINYFSQQLKDNGVEHMMICSLSENLASIRLAEKVGAKLVRTQTNYMKQNGSHQDLYTFLLPL